MIHGVGIDIVDVERFRAAMERWGERLTGRLFTGMELEYCMSKKHPERHLAARFAAKVSFFKALGRPMRFRDVEITRGSDGRPSLGSAELAGGLKASVSITHDGNLSLAQTIVESGA